MDPVNNSALFVVVNIPHNAGVAKASKSSDPLSFRMLRDGDPEAFAEIVRIKRIPPADLARLALESLIDSYLRDRDAWTPPLETRCVKSAAAMREAVRSTAESMRQGLKP